MYREEESAELETQGPMTRMDKFWARYDLWEPNANRILAVYSILLVATFLGCLYLLCSWQIVTMILHTVILMISWTGAIISVVGSIIFITDSSDSTIKKSILLLPLTVIGVLLLVGFTYISVSFIFPYYG